MTTPLRTWSGEDIPTFPPDIDALFARTRGPRDTRILVVGEAWGEKEAEHCMPFMGSSGRLLEEMLRSAGINPQECLFSNLINSRPVNNDMRYFLLPNERGATTVKGLRPNAQLLDGFKKLDSLIAHVRPDIIIGCGNWPLWFLSNTECVKTDHGYRVPYGIGSWAGSQLELGASPVGYPRPQVAFLPVLHPAAVLRQYHWRIPTTIDLSRTTRYLQNPVTWFSQHDEQIIIQPSPEQLRTFLSEHDGEWTCDLETYGQLIHIVGLSFGNTACAIPFFHIHGDGSTTPTYNERDFAAIWTILSNFFQNPKLKLVGQNFLYDIQYIHKYFHALPEVIFDTMVAQYILFPALAGFKGLDKLSRFYCDHHIYWKDERKESTKAEDTERACRYNARDLFTTAESKQGLHKALVDSNRLHLFMERMELFPVLRDMMLRGTKTNEVLRREQHKQCFDQMKKIGEWLDSVIPPELLPESKSGTPWYRSPPQRIRLLYHTLGIQGGWDREKEGFSTDKEVLAQLSVRYPHLQGLFSALILYGSLSTIASGYLSAPLGVDGRMHCSYNLAGPSTFRLASSSDAFNGGTNLQNILRERKPMDLLEQDIV